MTASRRTILAGAVFAGLGLSLASAGAAPPTSFPFRLPDEEWRRRLTAEQFRVLRQHATERAFSSPLDREHRTGKFHCAGCEHAVFDSAAKFDSGTGWPSFFEPIAGGIGTSEDRSLFFRTQTEVHCANCGSHLGHVFNDGPRPSGLRYCMNGVAMVFRPAGAAAS
ncbi:MAG: peptide-methionine (R)-S-oxide reductase [Rhodospirillales bacterium]|jgi:peptide-methionine (R)-S-oxide reductase|nr:peptide-methionine (R)-S-oxide reductase [Rhodospirillales bacterium]